VLYNSNFPMSSEHCHASGMPGCSNPHILFMFTGKGTSQTYIPLSCPAPLHVLTFPVDVFLLSCHVPALQRQGQDAAIHAPDLTCSFHVLLSFIHTGKGTMQTYMHIPKDEDLIPLRHGGSGLAGGWGRVA
jgi:hypothetical protein